MGIGFRPPSPSRHDIPRPGRPGDNSEGDWRRRARGTSYERRRKRSRSRSHDGERVRRLPDRGIDERASQRAQSESRVLTSSSGSSSTSAPHTQVVKGKGKAVDVGRFADEVGPSTSRSSADGATIDKRVGEDQACELPNAEHTVIVGSKYGNRDRAPKALTLRQSVQAHLSLPTEPLRVSRPPARSGPDPRHGRPSLLERISGMEEVSDSRPVSVSTVHLGSPAGPAPPSRPAVVQPEQSGAVSNDVGLTGRGTIDIDNHPDPISNLAHQDHGNLTARTERPDRVPRVSTKDVLERTRVRLAKMKNVIVAGVPPTAPTPPPIPPDPSTPTEPDETTPPTPVVATLRNKLLERLESERKRVVGAASGEPEVEPVAGNTGEDSLRAELRARNQLRARLAVAKADRHVGNSEP